MKNKTGPMGRVAMAFFVTTILPIFLMVLNRQNRLRMDFCIDIMLVAGILQVMWIYMGIIRPLDELKQAARRIESGDLDFTIEAESGDEFGELMEAFEQMRIKLKISSEEKIKNDRENKELISNIAHDLKTPLTTIKGYSEGLIDGIARSPEKQFKYLKTIYNKSNEMDRLIDELNYYAKIECNRIPYHFRHINVHDYFCDCVDEIGIDMESLGIKFSYENSLDRRIEMIADPEQLRKVINNIISNSVKYMDDKKKEKIISVSIEDEGDFVRINIRDNGKGISKKDIPHIFERFYRTDASRNSSKGGSGIGLSIVRKIIEDSGGRIWAGSEEGEGTCISFVLRKYLMNNI